MIFTQFLTLGLMILAVRGGALGGYLIRVRQEVVTRQKEALAVTDERKPVIEVQAVKGDSR